jgi:hypothetical protein
MYQLCTSYQLCTDSGTAHQAAKPVIESKKQLGPARQIFIYFSGELKAGGNSICLSLTGALL